MLTDRWALLSGDPFAASKSFLPALISITMFAIGCMLPRNEVNHIVMRWPLVLSGTAIQYTIMPLLAVVVVRMWNFQADALAGVVIVGCVPGAMASNVLTLNARGNTSYSVSLTTAATLLSPIIVPLALQLTLVSSKMLPISALWNTSYLLALTVVVPVTAGHLLMRVLPQWEPFFRRIGAIIANFAILWIIAVVVGLNRENLAALNLKLAAALLTLNIMGYAAGYGGGVMLRMPEPMRRALTLEVGMQNAGLGATLATQLFPDRDAIAIAPVLYTFGCMLTGTLLAQMWARLSERRRCENEKMND